MYRVTLPDGTRRVDKWLRVLRPIAYALMALAGGLLFLSPQLRELDSTVIYVMSGFLAGGGIACLYGAIRQEWVGEFVGLPLLIAAFLVFALVQTGSTAQRAPFMALANLSLMLSITATLGGRWREVKAVYRVSVSQAGEAAGDE